MEYLIKTGSEKVAMQCKENIYAIHTLKDFQYMEEGKDQGMFFYLTSFLLMISYAKLCESCMTLQLCQISVQLEASS